jgi:hypothetical protein
MTLSIMTLRITISTECHYADCRIFIVMLNDAMLNVVMMNAVVLSVIMLSVMVYKTQHKRFICDTQHIKNSA